MTVSHPSSSSPGPGSPGAPPPPPGSFADLFPGLTEEMLQRAVLAGYRMAASVRLPHFPSNAAGILRTAEATRVLRTELARFGATDFTNYSIHGSLSPDGTTLLVIVPGNSATGNLTRTPLSTPRGPRSRELIESNQLSFGFANDYLLAEEERRITTWYVLHHLDREQGVIYIEVACPTAFGQDNRVYSWRDRLVVAPVRLDDGLVPPDETPPPDMTPPIRIAIEPIEAAFDEDDDDHGDVRDDNDDLA